MTTRPTSAPFLHETRTPPAPPVVAAVEMGYGHLRAAHALADALGVELARADGPPWAAPWERAVWATARRFYETVSRGSQRPLSGAALRPLLDAITRIGPPSGASDPSRPTLPTRHLDLLVRRGFGRRLVEDVRRDGRTLLTTFFLPALAAQHNGYERTLCLVTDSDASRAWVPPAAAETAITFLAPCNEVVVRLRSYGVPPERIVETGFPLPGELLGGPELPLLRQNLADRLARLDPAGAFVDARRREIEHELGVPAQSPAEPPLLTYAVGGAGAQVELARRILAELRPALEAGRLRLCLVAGVRTDVAERFSGWIADAGLVGGQVEVLAEEDLDSYFRTFHARLADTDVLWTKPSEMTFFAGLGLPLLLASPVGRQERANRRWAEAAGAGIPMLRVEGAGRQLERLLGSGELAAAAWSGFRRLPADGLYRIVQIAA